jgi:hypothetical protein
MMRGMTRVAIALLPLAFVPVLIYLLADSGIRTGGGEKILVWVLPWTLWSLLFGVGSLMFWRRGWPLGRATIWSAAAGLVGILLAAALLAVLGQLGVAGRF